MNRDWGSASLHRRFRQELFYDMQCMLQIIKPENETYNDATAN
jgi:hypothetical protein